ncbi:DUF2800 domain-containing protein [Gammaproteobacteria bacterium]
MAHHELGPSSARRWMACPGSVRLSRDIPDTGSDYAEEGTRAHELAEICLNQKYNTDDLPHDTGSPDDDAWGKFPQDMRQHVQTYLDFVRSRPGKMVAEIVVPLENWVLDGYGTADAIIMRDDEADLVDLKYGMGVPVSAEDNPQLKLYALGAHAAYGWIYDIKRWNLIVHQPRLDNVSEWSISTDDLLAWGETVKVAAALAMTEDAPLIPGEKQCRFCKARAICRARADQHLDDAMRSFSTPVPKPETLDIAEIGGLLPRIGEIESWCADVRSYALQQALEGASVPGHKLVEGRSIRRWVEESLVVGALTGAGIPEADLFERSLIGIPAAEKLLGGKKKAAPALSPLVVKPQGKPALVPESDERLAIHPQARLEEVFSKAA